MNTTDEDAQGLPATMTAAVQLVRLLQVGQDLLSLLVACDVEPRNVDVIYRRETGTRSVTVQAYGGADEASTFHAALVGPAGADVAAMFDDVKVPNTFDPNPDEGLHGFTVVALYGWSADHLGIRLDAAVHFVGSEDR